MEPMHVMFINVYYGWCIVKSHESSERM